MRVSPPMKWNRTRTSDWPAACGIGMSIRVFIVGGVNTVFQVVPPSRLRSTVPVWPGKPMYSLSNMICGSLWPDRSTAGEISEVSCWPPSQ